MLDQTEASQITNRLKYSIHLLLVPLPKAGFGSQTKPSIYLGSFNSDPGLREGDWFYLNNFPVREEHHNIKAQVKEREVTLTWQGDSDKSVLEIKIFLEMEDRDLRVALTEEIDPAVAKRIKRINLE